MIWRVIGAVIALALVWYCLGFLGIGEPFMTVMRVAVIGGLIWVILGALGVVPGPWGRNSPP